MNLRLLTLILFLLLWIGPVSSTAQETTVPPKTGLQVLSDTTRSGYENQDALGGPKTIGAQLAVDNQQKAFFFRVPVRVMTPWYDFKKRLHENTGLQLSLNYTSVFIRSSAVIDPETNSKSAASGIFDIQLGWNLLGRKSGKNKGTLFVKVNSRHSYAGDKTSPMFHGIFESGYYGLPAVGFNDYSFRFLEFNWQQSLIDDKLTIVAGKVDPTNYFNFHGLVVPWQHGIGYGTSLSGTVNWPNQGTGVIAGYKLTEKFYAMAGLTDVYGDRLNNGQPLDFGRNFFDGNFFTAVEVGYVPSMAERYFKKISITYWHTDAYVNPFGTDISSGRGLAISGHWFFKERFVPWVRFAFSNGNGENAFYKKDVQIGHGLRFRTHDILGAGFSWAETNIPDAKDQMTLEVYYRFNVTEHLELTADYQLIFNPTFNPDRSSLSYWGLRGRITL